MKTTITLLMLTITLGLLAQAPKIGYYYDAAGNRIQRKVCIACRIANTTTTTTTTTTTNNKQNKENINSLAATILPNPAKGNLAIKVTQKGVKTNQYQVLVYDVSGRTIVNKKYNKASFKISIPANATPGFYFVKLISNDKIKQWKITKE